MNLLATNLRISQSDSALIENPNQAAETRHDRWVSVMISQTQPGTFKTESKHLRINTGSHIHIACTNPACTDGGLDPVPMVRELIEGEIDELRVEACNGREKRQPGHGHGTRCGTLFCIRVLYPDST